MPAHVLTCLTAGHAGRPLFGLAHLARLPALAYVAPLADHEVRVPRALPTCRPVLALGVLIQAFVWVSGRHVLLHNNPFLSCPFHLPMWHRAVLVVVVGVRIAVGCEVEEEQGVTSSGSDCNKP